MINFQILLEDCLEEAKKNKEVWGEIIKTLLYVYDKYKNMDVIETAFDLYFNNRKITSPDPKFYEYLARKKRESERNIDASTWTGDLTQIYNDIRSKVDPILGISTSPKRTEKLKSKTPINQKDFIKQLTLQTDRGFNKFVVKFAFDKYIYYLKTLRNPIRSGWWDDLSREDKYDLFGNAAKYPAYDEYRHRLAPWDQKKINTAFNEIKSILNPFQGVSEQTEWQKYHNAHPNSHAHSITRTTGDGNNRKTLSMSSKVRSDKQNPYKVDAMNQAEESDKILTPIDMKEYTDNFGIDFNDRRIKTPKGKTGIYLIPLPDGRWKSTHK
jgi:hypothetical protein